MVFAAEQGELASLESTGLLMQREELQAQDAFAFVAGHLRLGPTFQQGCGAAEAMLGEVAHRLARSERLDLKTR